MAVTETRVQTRTDTRAQTHMSWYVLSAEVMWPQSIFTAEEGVVEGEGYCRFLNEFIMG